MSLIFHRSRLFQVLHRRLLYLQADHFLCLELIVHNSCFDLLLLALQHGNPVHHLLYFFLFVLSHKHNLLAQASWSKICPLIKPLRNFYRLTIVARLLLNLSLSRVHRHDLELFLGTFFDLFKSVQVTIPFSFSLSAFYLVSIDNVLERRLVKVLAT